MSLLLTYILKFQIMSDNDYDYEFSDVGDHHSESSGHSEDSRNQDSDYEFEERTIGASVRHEDEDDQYDDGNADNSSGSQPTLQMCSKDKPGAMIEICKVCSAALAMVRPEIAKQFIGSHICSYSTISVITLLREIG